MSYLALYREFRPDTFDKIIGQEHIVRTLINQIKTDRVGHAYLFCGARGTGKTTCAKVFARAINCLSPNNGSPCGKCEVCEKLKNPTNLDILEMDAASNNKVENVRELRDKIQYPPVAGKYKVYIIDEVHMLTTEAFNALLKTLEEPPAHAVFILATTEVHKIPATILSRCLRFDFKLISTKEIAQHICKIYDKIGKKYQIEAVNLIAKAGEGSVRDALSIADICVSYSDGELTYDQVLDVLGASDRGKTEQLIKHMMDSETGEMLSIIDELLSKGKSVSILNKEVCGVLRDLLVSKTCKNAGEILGLPADKLKEFCSLSQNMQVSSILRAIEIFSQSEADLKYSTHPKIIFETAAVKASLPEIDYNIDALMARVNKLEEQVKKGVKVNITASKVDDAVKCEKPQNIEADKPQNIEAEKIKNSFESFNKVKYENAESGDNGVIAPLLSNNKQVNTTEKTEIKAEEKIESKIEEKSQPYIDEDLASLIKEGENSGYGEENGDYSYNSFNGFEEEKKPVKEKDVETEIPVKKQEVKVETKKEAVKKSESKVVPSNSGMDATLIWGGVLKKLRREKEIMLWVACQDVTASVKGDNLIVLAPGENEYSLLSRPENVEKLKNCVAENGLTNVKILKDESESEDNSAIEENVEKLKEIFKDEKFEVTD